MRIPIRRARRLTSVVLAAALSGACGGHGAPSPSDPTPDAERPPNAGVPGGGGGGGGAAAPMDELGPPVACGTALPGAPLAGDLVEAQPGYDDALAALDLDRAPDPLDFSGETALVQDLLRFMLGRRGTVVSRDEAIAAGGLGEAVLAAAADAQGGSLDLAFLRRGLYRRYPCSRPLPKDLRELERRYGSVVGWPRRQVRCSLPKNRPRTLYENRDVGIYVAQTAIDGIVRETEVLFTNLRDDGQLDFAVYTSEGELSDRSTFVTSEGAEVVAAAPFICTTCHVDAATGAYTNVTPLGRGTGCP